jgi:Tetratricopeptide repeat
MEREKFEQIQTTKKQLEKFQSRELQVQQSFANLLGPVVVIHNNVEDTEKSKVESEETKQQQQQQQPVTTKTVRITRDMVDAGKRVLNICDTSGTIDNDRNDTIVLTQDLSHLESKMKANAMSVPKTYKDDAENDVIVPEQSDEQKYRTILGVIKLFIANVHNCTIVIKCKVISGTLEFHNCSNIKIQIESTATIATIQADLCNNVIIEFRDAPSGKNTATDEQQQSQKLYWGDDKDDRIFHAGIINMKVCLIRDGYVDDSIVCDYIQDGAESVGNASAKEFQFVTSCVNGKFITEKVLRTNSSTGKNSRAMTERELLQEKERREQAAKFAVKMANDMIQIKDKDGNVVVSKTEEVVTPVDTNNNNDDDDVIEEVYSSMSKEQIDSIVQECDELKQRGNDAFGAGEYGQAILHYSLALDKASELPDNENDTVVVDANNKSLFARDVLYSNRAACFLKLGQHEKSQIDCEKALQYNPNNIKANFRLGLSLHAQQKFIAALPILVKAQKIEPSNKQIQQALQFCEVRLEQERRKQQQ